MSTHFVLLEKNEKIKIKTPFHFVTQEKIWNHHNKFTRKSIV